MTSYSYRPRFALPFDAYLASVSRQMPPVSLIHAWEASVGIPATDAEFSEALSAGLIPPPSDLESLSCND